MVSNNSVIFLNETIQVGLRLSKTVIEKIDLAIGSGYSKNRADFCERAVIEHLIKLKLLILPEQKE